MRRKFARRPRVEELEPRVVPSAYYVAPTGSDGGNGSSAAPWKTLQHAADVVVAGDTVNVAAGQYQGFIMNDTSRQGTASSYIRFLAQPGAQITTQNADGSGIEVFQVGYVDLEGFTVSGITGNGTSDATSGEGIAYRDAPGGIVRGNTVANCTSVGIYTGHANYALIEGNNSYGSATSHGIYVANTCTGVTVRGNSSHDNYKSALHFNGDISNANPGEDGIVRNALVEDNRFYHNGLGGGYGGINADGLQFSTIRNNLIYNNENWGIFLFQVDAGAGPQGDVLVNNTIDVPAPNSVGLHDISIENTPSGATPNRIENNLLIQRNTDNNRFFLQFGTSADAAAAVSDYNLFADGGPNAVDAGGAYTTLSAWQAKGYDAHTKASTSAANIVSPSTPDYHLLATAPAIDAGTATDAPSTDFDGNARPQGNGYDIGAYEYVTGSPSPTATHLGVSAPSAATAGTSFSVTVSALDGSNNVVPGYTGTVHFTSSDGQASLPADYTFTAADAGHHTFTVTLKTAGSQTVTATDKASGSVTGQASVTVGAASASSLLFGAPSSATAGSAFSFTVTAKDAYGNTATGYAGTAHFTSTDAAASLPADYTFTAADAGSHSFSATLKTTGSQTVTATDTANASVSGSATVTVNPAATGATHLGVSAPSSATAGASFSVTVSALDGSNNVVPGYTGTVHFTSSDAGASLPADYTFTATDAGSHTFTATLATAGSQKVTATDTASASVTGSATVSVSPGAAVWFAVGGYPSPTTAGTAHNFTVTAEDHYGNVVPGYAGTAHFTSSDAAAVLPADYTFTSADAGSHTFSATLNTPGTQSISAADTAAGGMSGGQNNITVNPAPAPSATQLGVSAPPSATAGASFSVTVSALDGSNNVVPGYTGTVHFASSDAGASLPADYTFTAADAGSHTFTVTLVTAGNQTVTATDTTSASVTGSATVTVSPGAAVWFAVGGYPSPTTTGASHTFTVAAEDHYGNVVPGYAGTAHFTSSDTLALLPADYTFTSADAGSHTFSATLNTPGTQSISAADTAGGGMSGGQNNITVKAPVVLPTVGIAGPAAGVRGEPLSYALTASESGLPASSLFTYGMDWNGDGIVDQTVTGPSGTAVTHVFPAKGTYKIQVKATDPSGNTSSWASLTASITAVAVLADPLNPNLKALFVGGTTGSDTITLSPANTSGGISVTINGVGLGTFTPTGHIFVYGQGGNDTIKETTRKINGSVVYITAPAFLFGGSGTDTLDARGSKANNVLVGGTGSDTLYGGLGRDLLIGGAGADVLYGNGGGDLEIGGSTAYDGDLTALNALITEWGRTDVDYATRVAHLNGTLSGGLNGSYVLNSATVFDDGVLDALYAAGGGMDWYLYGTGDVIHNQKSGETATFV